MPNKIQSQEYSRDSGTDDVSYNSDGDPNLLNANRNDDGQWLNTNYDKPDNNWNQNSGFAFASGNSLYFSSFCILEEFSFASCFTNCPFQPPNILPTSSIFNDSAIYFLLSKDFVSQRIIRSIFNKSFFLIAKTT